MSPLTKVLFLLLGAVVSARADYLPETQTLDLFGGATRTPSDVHFHLPSSDGSRLANTGASFGADYFYYLRPEFTVGVGPGLIQSWFSSRESRTLIPNYVTHTDLSSTAFFANVKIPYPYGHVCPYITGGIGLHHTAFSLTARPVGTWPNASTTEERTFYHTGSWNFAAEFGAGVDWFVTENIFIGPEVRWVHLSGAVFSVEPDGTAQGLRDLEGSVDTQTMLLHIGWKWGKIQLLEHPGPAQIS